MAGPIDREEALSWVLEKIAAARKKAEPKAPSFSLTTPLPAFKPAPPPRPSLPAMPTMATPVIGTQAGKKTKKELAQTKTTELELWRIWKDSGHEPEHLDPLLKSLSPLVSSHAAKFKNRVEIPTAAIDFEMKQHVVKALHSYDPSKGSLGTWVGWSLKKGNRFITNRQNFARISENLTQHIGKYQAVRSDLTERLGFEPDSHTIAEESGLSLKDVKRIQKELRKGLISTGAEEFSGTNLNARQQEVVELIVPQLTPQERAVHEYTFGLNGRPRLAPGQIAKTMKLDNSKVSKLRTSIFNKMKPHLE